jgi:hypothetical protein
MNTKLLASTLLVASLLAPAVAFAQTEKAAPSSATESKSEAKAKPHAIHHTMRSSHSTVGMSSRSAGQARPGAKSVSRKPAD